MSVTMSRAFISPLSEGQRPAILFRVEHSNNSSFRNHNMVARDFSLPTTLLAFDTHLSWNRSEDTPFLSFFDSWEHALRRRNWWLNRGENNVVIIAIWAGDIHNMYSAEDVAKALGYNNNGYDNRRRLAYHRHEYLIWGGISADDYRILAVLTGDGLERPVLLRSSTHVVETSLPGDHLDNTPREDATQGLWCEMKSNAGIIDESIYDALVAYLGGGSIII